MHHDLIPILACPDCRGDLRLTSSVEATPDSVQTGRLTCESCRTEYAIERGVPRLVVAERDVEATGKRFNIQWVSWSEGAFEETTRAYGFDNRPHTVWLKEKLDETVSLRPGDWALDAGCGPGEITSLLAESSPESRFVGMDLGVGALEVAQRKHGHRPNLDYVQGNIMSPPFKPGTFRWGMSKGMLHCTPDTQKAFASFRTLLAEEAGTLIWIYPTAQECPEWKLTYFLRDRLFFGKSYRIPPRLLRWMCHGMVMAFFPLAEYDLRKSGDAMTELSWYNPRSMTMKQRYQTQVFYLHDTLLPKYLFRHKISEVQGWLVQEGLKPIYQHHGFYTARTVVSGETCIGGDEAEQISAGDANLPDRLYAAV